jgi:hypothetical protein
MDLKEAIQAVNEIIRKHHTDPVYRVYSYTPYEWGWEMYWMPPMLEKILYGSSNYLVHKNGYIKEFNKVAWDHKVSYLPNTIKFFVEDAEKQEKPKI